METSPEELLLSGDVFFTQLYQAIRSAHRTIDIQCYIFALDRLGTEFANELCLAQARGVRVRVILDGFGSYPALEYLDTLFSKAGIELRIYRPLRYVSLLSSLFSIPGRPTLRHLIRHLNRRNHRKCFVVDEKDAFIGSMNVTEVHLQRFVGSAAFHDVGVRCSDVRVVDLTTDFEFLWLSIDPHTTGPKKRLWSRPKQQYPELLHINTSLWQRRKLHRRIIERLSKAQRTILIANAYVVPNRYFMRALIDVASRGCDVRLIVSRKSDVAFMKYVASGFYQHLLSHRVRIFQYTPSILHMKTMLIDDWAIVGSSNLNHRSLLHDLEVDAVITDPERRAELYQQLLTDLRSSTELTLQDLQAQSWLARFIRWLGFRLRYWL